MPSIKVFDDQFLVDARPDRLDLRDRPYRPPLKSIDPEFPQKDHIEAFLPLYQDLVLDQGDTGYCTGFGLASVINYQYWFRDQIVPRLQAITATKAGTAEFGDRLSPETLAQTLVSPRMLYQLAKLYDEWDGEDYSGSSCRGALRGWHHHGVCLDTNWPRDKSGMDLDDDTWISDAVNRPLGAYYRVETRSIADMQAAIQEVHAVYVSSRIHDGWNLRKNCDVLPTIDWTGDTRTIGAHAYAIIGYNRDGFIVQNSWGKSWGCGGFALLSYRDWLANAMDAWVAVYGAPVALDKTPVGVTVNGLQTQTTFLQADENSRMTNARSGRQSGRWSDSDGYMHSIVLGNEGRPITRLIRAETGADHVRIAAEENVLAWCKKKRSNRKLVIYAHGGLNDEKASMRRISILGPHFLANGMYPLFLTWKTGLLETLGNVFRDAYTRDARSPGLERSEGIGDWFRKVSDRITNANDYTWEAIARRVAVKALWTEMKENAALASKEGGGTFLLADHLDVLRTKYPELEIHLIGHSAGSIIFGHLFDRLRRNDVKVDSMHLYAAACTLDFASRHYGRAFKDRILDRDNVYFDLLTDRNERDDQVAGLYRKSLLYLISRALEKDHKTPLLGMHVAWDQTHGTSGYIPDTFPRDADNPDIRKWKKVWGRQRARLAPVGEKEIRTSTTASSAGERFTKASHGSFDNNIDIVTQTMARILGRTPSAAIDDLSEV